MSTSIEQRVVQMKFDNKQFESGVAQTMSTLEELERQLKFKDAAQGFESISKAADSVSLDSLSKQTDSLGSKFDALAVIAISALNRITNEAITAGKNLVKSLSIDPVTTGWSKYEARTASVQTLVNATGRSVEDIEKYMDKLMRYSDETSYGFSEMTTALGSMVSAGGDIEKLVPLLEGFGNAVSFSGKGAKEFSLAIYQLSQAYGAGVLMKEDWKPIQTQLQGAKQLKEIFIQVGEELGKIEKGVISYETFDNTLKDKWLDQEVMEEAFGRFASMTEKAFAMIEAGEVETVADAYKILAETCDDYRIRAALAAQEAKSFTEAIDATKDAVSTKWMESFQIIFGNYEEATKLWTELTDTLYELFAASGDVRNEILKVWKDLGGRDEMILAVKAAFEALAKPMGAVRDAFNDIFFKESIDEKGTIIYKMTVQVKEFFEQITLSDEAVMNLRIAFELLLLPVYGVVQALRVVWSVAVNLIKIFAALINTLLILPSRLDIVEKALRKLFGDARYERIASALATIFEKLGNAFSKIGEKIVETTKSITEAFSPRVRNSITSLADALAPIGEWILDRIVDGFELLASFDYSIISNVATAAIESFVNGFSMIIEWTSKAIRAISEFTRYLITMSLPEFIDYVISKLKSFGTSIAEFVKSLDFSKVLDTLKWFFMNLGEAIQYLLDKLTPGKILVFAFGASLVWMFINLATAIAAFKNIATGVSGVLDGITGVLKGVQNKLKGSPILQVAVAITVLAVALGALSQIDSDRLWNAAISLGVVTGALVALVAAMALITKFVANSKDMADNLLKVSESMLIVSGTVLALSSALLILSKVDLEGLGVKFLALAGMLAIFAGAMFIVSKSAKKSLADSVFLLSFAISLGLIITALGKLHEANLGEHVADLLAMTVIVGLLSTISMMSKNIKLTTGVGLLLTVGALWVFAKAIQPLADLDFGSLIQALLNVIVMVGMVSLITKAVKTTKGESLGLNILSMSAGLMVLYFAIKNIGELDTSVVIKGVAAIGVLMIFVGAMYAISDLTNVNSTTKELKGSFIALAAGILILSLAIGYIGSLDLYSVVKGTAVVLALMTFMAFLMEAAGNAQKSTASIVTMTLALGLVAAAVALLTLIDSKEIIASAASLCIAFAGVGLMFNSINDIKFGNSMSALLLIGGVIVLIGGLMHSLSTMQDPSSVLQKAEAIGIVLLALTSSMVILTRGVNLDIADIKDVGIIFKAMLSVSALAGVLLWAISNWANPEAIIEKAGALGVVLLALASSIRILDDMRIKSDVGSIAKVLAALAIIGGLLTFALSKIENPQSLIEKSASLGLILLSLAASMRIISGIENTTQLSALIVTGSMMAVLGYLVTGILAILNSFKDANGLIIKATALSELLLVMTACIAIISTLSTGLKALGKAGGYAIAGAAIATVIVAALGALIVGVGYLLRDFEEIDRYLTIAENVIPRIGAVIGGFIGALVGGAIGQFAEGVLDGLAGGLAAFAGAIQPFLDLRVEPEFVASIARLAEAILIIVGAEFLNQLLAGGSAIMMLVRFGEQLVAFAPFFVAFSKQIEHINKDAVDSASKLLESLGTILANIPTEGGLMGAIFGNRNIQQFGSGLKALAKGVADYATALSNSNIDQNTINMTNSLTTVLVNLANKVPKTGGLMNFLFSGQHDIGEFGAQLVIFAEGMNKFIKKVNKINYDKAKTTAITEAANLLVDLANKVPKTGALMTFFGEHNIGTFGEQLSTFADGIKEFFDKVKNLNVDQTKVESIKQATEVLITLAEKVPSTGRLIEFFGGKDIGKFGKQIGDFGDGLKDFFSSIAKAKLDSGMVELAKDAGLAFAEISNSIAPNTGVATWWESASLDVFGDQVSKLGKGLYGFYEAVEDVDWKDVSYALDQLERIIAIEGFIDGISDKAVQKFADYMYDLASTGIDEFIDAFDNAEYRMSRDIVQSIDAVMLEVIDVLNDREYDYSFLMEAMADSINDNKKYVLDRIHALIFDILDVLYDNRTYFVHMGFYLLSALQSGLDKHIWVAEDAIEEVMRNVIDRAKNILGIRSGSSRVFYDIAMYTIQGYVNGLNHSAESVYKKLTEIGNIAVASFEDSVGVASPSTKFAEIAMYTMLGFKKGIEDNTGTVTNAMIKMGGTLLQSIKDFYGINSPSTVTRDEVGRYIVQGIAEGITNEMSAEEAASKKAQNIINAFKDEFDKWSLDTTTADLEYKLWSKLNPNASDSDALKQQSDMLDKKLTYQAQRVNAAQAQYMAIMQSLGESAEETQSAYNTYLQEQITMAGLAEELFNLYNNQDTSGKAEAQQKYLEILNTQYDKFTQNLGFTREEFMAYARDVSGIDKYLDPVTLGYKNLNEIIEDYMNNAGTVDIEIIAQTAGEKTGQSVGTGIATGITNSGEEINNAMQQAFEQVNENSEEQGIFAGTNTLLGYIGALRDGETSIGNALVSAIGGAGETLLGYLGINSPSKLYEQYGEYTILGLVLGLNNLADLPADSMAVIAQNMKVTVDNSSEQWTTIGEEIANGLAEGILAGESTVIEAAIHIAKAAIEAARDTLGVHSPSKEYQTIGEMLDLGLANGIVNNGNVVEDAVETMLNGVRDVMEDSALYDNDYTYSVTPVIDDRFASYNPNRNISADGTRSVSDSASKWWVAPDSATISAIQKLADSEEIRKAAVAASEATYRDTIEELKAAVETLNEKPSDVNFTQNNYSPESLDSSTIFRNTRTLLSSAATALLPSGASLNSSSKTVLGSKKS